MRGLLQNLFCRLLNLFLKPAEPAGCSYPLQQSRPIVIDLKGFKKGVDNVHTDVCLSPKFQAQVKGVTASMFQQEMGRGNPGDKVSGPTRQAWEDFRGSYSRMVEAAIHRAKVEGGLPLVQMVQLAAIKFTLRHVQMELDRLRQELKGALASGSGSESNRMELNERLSWVVRNRSRLHYKLNQQMLSQLLKVEEGTVGELRQSLLGERWSLPQELLANTLLYAENPLDDDVTMKHYVLMGQGEGNPYSFSAIDSQLPSLFRREKPRTKGANASAEVEVKERTAWADVPANVDVLFNSSLYRGHLKVAKKQKNKEEMAKLTAHIQFQKCLLGTVENKFRSWKLMPQVVASYELGPLYKDFSTALTAQQLHQYLAGKVRKKEILRTVQDKQRNRGKALPLDLLTKAVERVRVMTCRQQRERLVRFLKDFVTFRRDLGYYNALHQAMDQIQLLDDPAHIKLSRANYTLYEFRAANEEGAEAKTVRGHVILKADVRGSTTMVAELRNRGLNPASHFSLNFFTPLNELIETYGAGKVFIEGDAVILSIMEHEEALEHQLGVARMCGLAKRLLSMTQAQNDLCRKDGLPELELGIGVVFQDEPPMLLYDGNNPIMISSAIGKADRFSSCSWMLRKHRSQQGNTFYTNVDIYEIPEGDPLRGEKGEVHLRYNLNGIELDQPAFVKLQSEIALQRLEVLLPGDEEPTTIYTGRYPDLKGAMHRVVVREGRMRLLDKKHPKLGELTQSLFYEVVTGGVVLEKVTEALKSSAASES
jgi:hypothetical protein